LAPYSPEDTPLERFWRWRKAKVSGATALDTLDAGRSKVRQLLWHSHEAWLTSTIHCDCTDYQGLLERFLTSYLSVMMPLQPFPAKAYIVENK
jgi:hypothetical protein